MTRRPGTGRTSEGIPRLADALDAGMARVALQAMLDREYPDRRLTLEGCGIARVNLNPERACEIVYRVEGHDLTGQPFEQWFHGKMSAAAWRPPFTDEAMLGDHAATGFWKPAVDWPELGMKLIAFPHDAGLPDLDRLVDLDTVRDQASRLAERGLGWVSRSTPIRCRKIEYRPGKNVVLRYEFGSSDESRARQIYCKAHAKDHVRRVYGALMAILASPAYRAGALDIPVPLACFEDTGAIWLEGWPGERISAVGGKRGWEALAAPEVALRLASLLAALHRTDRAAAGGVSGGTPDRAVENAREAVERIQAFLPELSGELGAALIALRATAAWGAPPRALIHGNFEIEAVSRRADRLGFIDVDSLAVGDPLYDVANLVASVLYGAIARGASRRVMDAGVERFLVAYAEQVSWSCDRFRIQWYVAGFLLAKLHASLQSLEIQSGEEARPVIALIAEALDQAATGRHAAGVGRC